MYFKGRATRSVAQLPGDYGEDHQSPSPRLTLPNSPRKSVSVPKSLNSFCNDEAAAHPLGRFQFLNREGDRSSVAGASSCSSSSPSSPTGSRARQRGSFKHVQDNFADDLAPSLLGLSWSSDLIAYPNNTVRRELLQFHKLLTFLEEDRGPLGSGAVVDVTRYLSELVAFLTTYMDAGEKVIFAHLDPSNSLPSSLLPVARKALHSRLHHLLSFMQVSEDDETSLPVEQTEVLRRTFDKVSRALGRHCVEQEAALPRLLQVLVPKKSQQAKLIRAYYKVYLASEQAESSVVILSNWVRSASIKTSPRIVTEWKTAALGKTATSQLSRWEQRSNREQFINSLGDS